MINYNYISSIVGRDNCFFDNAHLEAYSYDATNDKYRPDLVVYPRNESDISRILKYCNDNIISIVPRGSGSGFSGGALPVNGGIVLALEKHFNNILEIDNKNLVAIVQPAVINKHLQDEVEKLGLFYPPDPASLEFSTIGGNVSENAGGMRAVKYGVTKDYVIALRAVMPNGDIICAGKKTIKDVAGYNLVGMLIASEGTLAVITEITIRLLPKPKYKSSAMGVFSSIEDSINAVCSAIANGITPVAMEFLDNLTINAIEKKFSKGLPTDAGSILIAQVDGDSKNSIDTQIDLIKDIFMANKCIEFVETADDKDENNLWSIRRSASQSISIYGEKKINEDISVPRSKLHVLLTNINEIGNKYNLKIPCFGHAGDGNVHVNIMTMSNKDSLDIAYKCVDEILRLVLSLGGTLSGEHGIGISKAKFMDLAFSNEEMALFRRIKNAFDPNNILNPGKMGL